MRTAIDLYWTEGKRAIVPADDPAASVLFAETGRDLAPSVVQRYGLERFIDGASQEDERPRTKRRTPRENK